MDAAELTEAQFAANVWGKPAVPEAGDASDASDARGAGLAVGLGEA